MRKVGTTKTSRRDFLTKTAATTAALSGVGWIASCTGSSAIIDAGSVDAKSAALDRSAPDSITDGRVMNDASPLLDTSTPTCNPTNPDALGPFHAANAPFRTVLADTNEPGDRIKISGVVYGPDCHAPVSGAIVDVWQADAAGTYHSAQDNYRLRGQIKTGADGRYEFESVVPGHYDDRPKHFHYIVTAPGYQPLTTQLYFQGDPRLGANDSCPPPTCHSEDPGRAIQLTESTVNNKKWLNGTFDVVLKKT